MKENARTWSELSGFKRDTVVAVLRRGGSPLADEDDLPYGLGIKQELSIIRDAEVNHGRIYPNLDELTEAGLMSKGSRDKRTNTYRVTEAGIEALAGYLSDYVGIDVDPDLLNILPERLYAEQTHKTARDPKGSTVEDPDEDAEDGDLIE
jgi:DNA-binding PadR family transcriptional regulator